MLTPFKIFKSDVVKLVSNWAMIVILFGMVVLPALYAWLNIRASWDPYSNLKGLKVAVVNNDKGYSFGGESFSIGAETVNALKDNDKVGWQFFVDTDPLVAIDMVRKGDIYAALIIPESFSHNVTTILDQTPVKPTIEYYVNEKENAVAPKITNSVADSLQKEITATLLNTVVQKLLTQLNNTGIDAASVETLFGSLFDTVDTFPTVDAAIDRLLTDAKNGLVTLDNNSDDAQLLCNFLNTLLSINTQFTKQLTDAGALIDQIDPQLQSDVLMLSQNFSDISLRLDGMVGALDWGKPLADQDVTTLIQDANGVAASLKTVRDAFSKDTAVDNYIRQMTDDMLARLTSLSAQLTDVKGRLDSQNDLGALLHDLQGMADHVGSQFNTLSLFLSQQAAAGLQSQLSGASSYVAAMNSYLANAKELVGKADSFLAAARGDGSISVDTLTALHKQLKTFNTAVKLMADKLRLFGHQLDIDSLTTLLAGNINAEGDFVASPIQLNAHRLYAMANYGTGLTPFYTVLAIWVGALFMGALFRTRAHNYDQPASTMQVYWGKYLLFLCTGLLQGLIITVGDLLLLGVKAAEPLLFIGLGMFYSVLFSMIVYVLVALMGNIGKAVAIIFMLLQLTASGGTFPIQVAPGFFQAIHWLMPFSYAISAMREAISGVEYSTLSRDMVTLCWFFVIFLLLGPVLYHPLHRLYHKFEKKVDDSQIIA